MLSFPRLIAGLAAALLTVAPARAADPPTALEPLAQVQQALAKATWTPLTPGIARLALKSTGAELTAYRLDPAAVHARILPQLRPGGSTAAEIVAAAKPLLVINGGFFYLKPDGSIAPTGMLVASSKTLAPRTKCKICSGVLYTDAMGLHIGRPKDMLGKRGVTNALQVGPMLVERGAVLRFRDDGPAAARSAVCVTGEAILVLALISPLSLHDTAALMQAPSADGGFGCVTALNLDGGSSTQLVSAVPGAVEEVGFARPVQNFLAFELR